MRALISGGFSGEVLVGGLTDAFRRRRQKRGRRGENPEDLAVRPGEVECLAYRLNQGTVKQLPEFLLVPWASSAARCCFFPTSLGLTARPIIRITITLDGHATFAISSPNSHQLRYAN